MKTILVPTDFSSTALNAANYAAGFAKAINARILLLHTYHTPNFTKDINPVITDPEKLHRDNEEQLKEEARRLVTTYSLDVKYRLKVGFLVDEILEAEKEVSLVIMGMNGAGRLNELFLGSMPTATVKATKKPVIIVPEKAVFTPPSKIVFACDYDPNTDVNALNALKEMVKAFNAVVYVVNIKHEDEVVHTGDDMNKKIEHKLASVQHIYSFPHNENMVEALNRFVEEHKAGLIAMIPHRYDIIDRLFHKSFVFDFLY